MPGMFDFDPNEYSDYGSYEPIPVGEYTAIIKETEDKPTKAGDGRYISVQFEIVSGDHSGRVVYTNLNLQNPNRKAVEIARQELATIQRAVGKTHRLSSASELCNIPLVIKVGMRKDQNGEMRNEIKGYYPADGAAPRPSQKAEGSDSKPGARPW